MISPFADQRSPGPTPNFPPGDSEEGVENRHKTLPTNNEEGHTVESFGTAPRETTEELVGGAAGFSQGNSREVSGIA